jgi:hypothetical protein
MLINYCMFLALPDVFSSSYTQFQKVESFGGNTNTILYLDSLSLSLSLSHLHRKTHMLPFHSQ